MYVTLPCGTVVHYTDDRTAQNTRPALLLVHGGNVSLTCWMPWISRMRGKRRVVAVDMPGHGGTGATRRADYVPEGQVRFLEAATRSLSTGLSCSRDIRWAAIAAGGSRMLSRNASPA